MPTRKDFKLPVLALTLGVMSLLSGCATLFDDNTQEVNVRLLCGERVVAASCNLQNGKGSWRLHTPGKTTVTNDNSSLEITCKAYLTPSFTVSVLPKPSISMLGNVLVGGVVGAAVDVYSNTGMKYPENINIINPNCK